MKKIKDKIYRKNGKLLEIGCGSGALLKFFSNKMKIYGVDYSPQLLSIAKKSNTKWKILFNRSKKKFIFSNGYFDSVVMYSCIQYFPNKKLFF